MIIEKNENGYECVSIKTTEDYCENLHQYHKTIKIDIYGNTKNIDVTKR